MTHFIRTTIGWVNTVHVATVLSHGKEDDHLYELLDLEGRILGCCHQWAFDPGEHQPLVPAAAGSSVSLVGVYFRSDGNRPTEQDVYVSPVPVVAWRIDLDSASPILLEPPDEYDVVVFPMSDGKWLDPCNRIYDGLDGVKAEALRAAQERWDEDHAREELMGKDIVDSEPKRPATTVSGPHGMHINPEIDSNGALDRARERSRLLEQLVLVDRMIADRAAVTLSNPGLDFEHQTMRAELIASLKAIP